MKDFKVLIFQGQDETLITSYQHPLNKRRIRMSFLNQETAGEYKTEVEKKFKKPSSPTTGVRVSSNLFCILCKKFPIPIFTKNRFI